MFPGNSVADTGFTNGNHVYKDGSVLDPDDEPPGALTIERGSVDRAGYNLRWSETVRIYHAIIIVQGAT